MILQTDKSGQTGYPFLDKPWTKYYSEDAIHAPLPQNTLTGYLFEQNTSNKNLVALNYYGNKITFRELFHHIKETAAAFTGLGIKRGDIVTIMSLNTPETIYCIYALNYIGAISNLVYLTLSTEEIIQTVRATDSRVIIVLDIVMEKLFLIREALSSSLIITLDITSGMPYFARTVAKLKRPAKTKCTTTDKILSYSAFLKKYSHIKKATPVRWKKDIPALLVYTSGTTGKPKGVILTNENINATAFQYLHAGIKISPGDTILSFMPPFLAIGFCLNIHMPLVLGTEEILSADPDPDVIAKMYRKYMPNHFIASPSIVWRVINNIGNKSMADCLTLAGGGESMPAEREKQINDFLASHYSSAKYLTGYGMTEFAATVTTSYNTIYKSGTIGIPLCRVNIKIVDPETGNALKYNEVGEMCFHTPSQMKGYYKDPKETARIMETDDDGQIWLHTGDLGSVDRDGFVHFAGRIKRIYMACSVDGVVYKIFPARTEETILEISEVRQCAVVVLTKEGMATEQIVFLSLKEGASESVVLQMVKEHCKKQLPVHLLPQKYIIRQDIPLTQSGKINYKVLEKMVRSEVK